MTAVHEARFYKSLPDNKVLCTLCPHDCRIRNNGCGACSVRYNRDGRLYTPVYDNVVAREVNPIEKKPFFQFHPGSYAYSISTVGCNLRCTYCQNWQISQRHNRIRGGAYPDCGTAIDGLDMSDV